MMFVVVVVIVVEVDEKLFMGFMLVFRLM